MRAWPKGHFWPTDVPRKRVGAPVPDGAAIIAGWDLYRVRTALVYYVLNEMKGEKPQCDLNWAAIERYHQIIEQIDDRLEG